MIKKIALCALLLSASASMSARSTDLIDLGWQFSKDQQSWQAVDLPHDWSIEGEFNIEEPSYNDGAFLPTGKGYYTKNLNIAEVNPMKRYKLYFEGAYMDSKVKVNGKEVGGHPYGYSSYFIDITPVIQAGNNTVEVSIDNSRQRNSRWYTGSGIYRHVWLITTDKVYIDPWGVMMRTNSADAKSAGIRVDVTVQNDTNDKDNCVLTVDVVDKLGNIVSSNTREIEVLPGSNTVTLDNIKVENPNLWDIDSPNLYSLNLAIKTDKTNMSDEYTVPIGIRTIEYSTDGLKLNGRDIVLNGACVHHDNGIVGTASYDASEWRKAKLMKDAGFNAIRCSHNPPAPAFLDACDNLGLLVIDEAFDGWRDSKVEHDYSELIDSCWRDDISAMVLRDRNHPSIMAWSIGNEVIERKKLEVVTTAHKLAGLCHDLDPTRPVTSALCAWDSDWEIYDPLAAELDITGYNYMIFKAEGDHKRVPGRVMWQTESYPRDAFNNWKTTTEHPYIIGDFVWTGLDYLGESAIGRHYYEGEVEGEHWMGNMWPWHGALCGDVEITGMRRPISHYRDMLYNRTEPLYMAVREPNGYKGKVKETQWSNYPTYESWNWEGWEGKPIEIEVISTEPTVSLYVNDEFVGEQPCNYDNGWKTVFTVPYTPGKITAKAGENVKEIQTAGAPAKIRLTADRSQYKADGGDIAYIIAEVVDSKGRLVPNAECNVEFTVTGPGKLIATGTADMKDLESYANSHRTTSQGRALASVRTSTKPGKIKVKCNMGGKTSEITIPVK